MKKQLNFAVILLICFGYLFYSCTGGNSGNESKKDSTVTSTSADSTTGSQNKKNLQHINLSIADTITNFDNANFTNEDSSNYSIAIPYESDVYPAIMSGEDFYNAYQKIGVEGDDYIYISLSFSSVHKNPFKIFADGVGASRIQTTRIPLKDFPYPVHLESAQGGPPPANQRLWVRPALLEKDSIDRFITNLKNDTHPINLEQDYSQYQIVIVPQVMTESKSGRPNQYRFISFH